MKIKQHAVKKTALLVVVFFMMTFYNLIVLL